MWAEHGVKGNSDSCSEAGETERRRLTRCLGGHGEESGLDYGRILIK